MYNDELQDAQEDAEAIAYVHAHLPQELKELYSDEQLYYFRDVFTEYCTESGILDPQNANADGYVEIDLEVIAQYITQKAAKEKYGSFDPEQIFFVVQELLDFDLGMEED